MSTMTSHAETKQPRYPDGPTAADLPIVDHDNDSLILRLHMTVNHLSRWLTPITDPRPIELSVRRGEPSVIELLRRMRDEELIVYNYMHAIVNLINPDLDKLPDPLTAPARIASDPDRTWMSVLAEFRRVRQSTCSLLRALPDNAWSRVGTSRREHDWQIRGLAERLAHHDLNCLYAIDLALDRSGAREHINSASRVHLDEILRLIPRRPR